MSLIQIDYNREITLTAQNGRGQAKAVYLLDENRNMEKIAQTDGKTDTIKLVLQPNTVVSVVSL